MRRRKVKLEVHIGRDDDGKRAADHAFNIAFAREKVPH